MDAGDSLSGVFGKLMRLFIVFNTGIFLNLLVMFDFVF